MFFTSKIRLCFKHFHIESSFKFLCFQTPLPETHCSRVKVPIWLQKRVLGAIWGPRSEPSSAPGPTFSAQKVDFGVVGFRTWSNMEPTWARFGAERVASRFFQVMFGPKLHVFYANLVHFTTMFDTFSNDWSLLFRWILIRLVFE